MSARQENQSDPVPGPTGSEPAGEPIIAVRDIHLTLASNAGPVDILKGIDLDVEAGSAMGLIGPSGSGKSTLLMVIAGLETVTSGSVHVADHDLRSMNEDELARFRSNNVGIVFQSFHLIPTMTALENVAVPLEFKGESAPFDKARGHLERVGLSHRLDHYPGQLSGGEQQRVAIARALSAGAKLICDETSPYALTGAIMARDRGAVAQADEALRYAAGNFYINDKCTGSVVGQQPFGGSRLSGTNDKAGSKLNLLRWTSVRSIKETFEAARHFSYPFHQES